MTIEIVNDKPLRLTEFQYDEYYSEYKRIYGKDYRGTPPLFETWVRRKLNENNQSGELLLE